MKVILVNSKLPLINTEPCCVCLGMFDGVHRGHQALIQKTQEIAREKGLRSAAATFVMRGDKTLIDTLDIRLEALENQLDYIFCFLFDETLKNQSPEDFIQKYLKDSLNAKEIVCGFNFRFGHDRTGDSSFLQSHEKVFSYSVTVMSPVMEGNTVISSTLIREHLRAGNIAEANHLLGRPFAITGFVRRGNQIGRTIQMPTINVPVDPAVIELRNGVYASKTEVDGIIHQSITNIGTAPTFSEKKKVSETFILDFDRDVYNKAVKVFLFKHLRGERKFADAEELKRTVKGDIEKCAQYY